MTITQLKYIIALDEFKSFNKAAEHCNVSISTLSMQVKKLEDQLNTQIFDRNKRPLSPTNLGQQIIEQARIGIAEIDRINNIVKTGQSDLTTQIHIGIIPTISPYLLPLFLLPFHQQYPGVKIKVEELVTEKILYKLYNNQIDVGILVTPLDHPNLAIRPLYYENFVGYLSERHPLLAKKNLNPYDLDSDNFWLLERGHCFRNQVLNICQDQRLTQQHNSIFFESGNLETLRKMVDAHRGYTLLPELATRDFSQLQKNRIRKFQSPPPQREVSLVSHHHFHQKAMMERLAAVIQNYIPKKMLERKGSVIAIQE